MSLNSNAIVTLEEAQTMLRLTSLSAEQSAMIESYVNDVSGAVELYCQRKIASQSVSSELHDGDGTRFLYPRFFPIVQLSVASSPTTAQKLASLQYRNTPDDSWTDIEDDIDHIFLDTGDSSQRSFIELYDNYFPVGRRNISLTYKAGYSTVPADIKVVVLEKIQVRWNESKYGNSWLGLGSVNTSNSGQNQSLNISSLEKRWSAILDRYRLPSIG